MKAVFLNPFLEAACEVMQSEAGVKLSRGDLKLERSPLTADDITVLVSLIGHVTGMALFSLTTATGLAIVSRMMSQEFHALDDLALSGLGELGNVISGRASIKLAEIGLPVEISPPTVLQGSGVRVSTSDLPRVIIPFASPLGDLTLHLAVRLRLLAHSRASSCPRPGWPRPLCAASTRGQDVTGAVRACSGPGSVWLRSVACLADDAGAMPTPGSAQATAAPRAQTVAPAVFTPALRPSRLGPLTFTAPLWTWFWASV